MVIGFTYAVAISNKARISFPNFHDHVLSQDSAKLCQQCDVHTALFHALRNNTVNEHGRAALSLVSLVWMES